MKEQDLIDLGFTKEVEKDFYYYVYDFYYGLSLISQANCEVVGDEWFVEVFGHESLKIDKLNVLIDFINVINKMT